MSRLDNYLLRGKALPKGANTGPREEPEAIPRVMPWQPYAMVSFEQKNGDRMAFPYFSLEHMEMAEGKKLILSFREHQITLAGGQPRELYDLLLQHRVLYVYEASNSFGTMGNDRFEVTKIDIRQIQ